MSRNKRVNVLVYSGPGSTPHSLRQTLSSLRSILAPSFSVQQLSTSALLNEPWPPTCAALVFPGGADLPYCRELNGPGNRRIKQYVQGGGKYIGFCAGAYYASKRCEFMEGDPKMEVMGDRELAFFPGTKRGLAFKGFRYQSEDGTRAAKLNVAINNDDLVDFKSYCNGGGVFVDAEDLDVEILARYADKLDVEGGTAAVVLCKIGEGAALLTGPHPEFAAANLDRSHSGAFAKVVESLEGDDQHRAAFLKSCLQKLGLHVNDSSSPVPSLSPIQLLSSPTSLVNEKIVSKWKDLLLQTPDGLVISAEHDTFITNLPFTGLPLAPEDILAKLSLSDETSSDFDIPKRLHVFYRTAPEYRETPFWNHSAFFECLRTKQFGKHFMYGEVVTSTNTLLEKNQKLLGTLPHGLTFTARTQVSGRGRGNNIWVSPAGSLMFSTVLWHPAEIAFSSPVVFVQYLAAMAVIKAVKAYGRGYDKMPVRLKWPNDIYAAHSSDSDSADSFVKIGGILVNSTYAGESYGLVVGVGINVANAGPTIGLDALAGNAGLAKFSGERLLANILKEFEDLYSTFCARGWGAPLENEYMGMWLHTEQVVTLETEGGMRARIKGITRDWGLLQAEELGWEDRPTGHVIALQSDSNSFDFFRGLVKRKV